MRAYTVLLTPEPPSPRREATAGELILVRAMCGYALEAGSSAS